VAAELGTSLESGLNPDALPKRPHDDSPDNRYARPLGHLLEPVEGRRHPRPDRRDRRDAGDRTHRRRARNRSLRGLLVVFGFITDYRAERALDALRTLSAPTARVVRGGLEREIPAEDLRPGDLLVLMGGQIVAADGRIAVAHDLNADESALTGESVPVAKSTEPVPADAPLPDRTSMAWAGTTVVGGSGRMVVTGIAGGTELGRIGKLVAGQGREETPLERQAEQLGRRLALLAIGLSALVTILGLLRDRPFWLMVETGVILAIAAIPKACPPSRRSRWPPASAAWRRLTAS